MKHSRGGDHLADSTSKPNDHHDSNSPDSTAMRPADPVQNRWPETITAVANLTIALTGLASLLMSMR
jgi:hypothetical protein